MGIGGMRLSVTPKRCGEALDVGGFPSEGAVRSDRSDSVEISEKITRWWIRQGGNGDVEAHEEAFCLATQAGDAVGASLGRESVG